jgi:hypothetical protein
MSKIPEWAQLQAEGVCRAIYSSATDEPEILIALALLAAKRRGTIEGLNDAAVIAEGTIQTRNWVPGSLYDTLRREVAASIRHEAAIRAAKEGK